MSDYLRGRTVIMTKERARSIKPILQWIKEASTREKIRLQAIRILKEIEGIVDWRQLSLSRSEMDLLTFVFTEFPDGTVEPGRQLSLFSSLEEPIRVLGEIPRRAPEPKPALKSELTAEEQKERDETVSKLGYQPKPPAYFDAIFKKRAEDEEEKQNE